MTQLPVTVAEVVSPARGPASSPAVTRAVGILDRLAAAEGATVRLSDLATALGLPKSSVLNICTSLVEGGLVQKVEGGYRLGLRLVELSAAYLRGVDEVRDFTTVCRELAPDFPDTLHLAVLGAGLEITYLARQEGRTLPVVSPIGRPLPANCTATGKSLLATLPAAEVERRVATAGRLSVLTPSSIGDLAGLRTELDSVSGAGHAVDDEETTPGLYCVGMMVPGHGASAGRWAVGITTLKSGGGAGRLEELVALLREITGTLGRRLGTEA